MQKQLWETYHQKIIKENGLYFLAIHGDFTPVCTTEIIAFSKAYKYFERINTKLLGLSVDSNASHLAWLNDIYRKTGIIVPFPIIADRNGEIARKYGMISSNVSSTETVRNVYIIDTNGIIRLILVYPMNVGRNIPEIIRVVEALQTADESKGATPANWMPCNKILMPMPKTFAELQERNKELEKNKNGMSWYLSYKEPSNCINANAVAKLEQPKNDNKILKKDL